VLAARYGNATHVTFSTEVLMGGQPIADRSFDSFTDVLDEIFTVRIYGGIHFRTACEEAAGIGGQVAGLVLATFDKRH
jgi:hypothetical protein